MDEKDERKQTGEPEGGPEKTEPAAEQREGDAKRPKWEEILADPEYRRRYDESVSRAVQKRLRGRYEAEKRLEALAPVLAALQERFGDEEPESLAGRIREEGLYGGEAIRGRLEALFDEAARLQEAEPAFDLLRELEDPRLLRMTAPHSGVSLADAWYALHRDEIGRAAARESLAALSRSVRSQGERPRELRAGREETPSFAAPRSLSREEREDLKKRILEAKAQGKKIPV